MVDPIIRSRSIVLTPAIENYILSKLQRLDNFLEQAVKIEITVTENSAQRNGDQLEISYNVLLPKNKTVRVEEHGNNLYVLIDSSYDRLKNALDKFKERIQEHNGNGDEWSAVSENLSEPVLGDIVDMPTQYSPKIVKSKVYEDNSPLHPMEAIERMELLNRSCFLFKNIENGKYAMVYKLNEGEEYGLIEAPE